MRHGSRRVAPPAPHGNKGGKHGAVASARGPAIAEPDADAAADAVDPAAAARAISNSTPSSRPNCCAIRCSSARRAARPTRAPPSAGRAGSRCSRTPSTHGERIQDADSHRRQLRHRSRERLSRAAPRGPAGGELVSSVARRRRRGARHRSVTSRRGPASPSISPNRSGSLLTDPAERLIARFLTDGLNEAGYLELDLDTVAEQLGAPAGARRGGAGGAADARSDRGSLPARYASASRCSCANATGSIR